MKKTILFDKHSNLNAKMSPFGGYLMPMQYEGIIKEHEATRNAAAIFDTCHMGEFLISGQQSVFDLENLLSCSVASIKIGQCKYGFLCNYKGGVIDDQILYRMDENRFFMVVNASNESEDFQWVKEHLSASTSIVNLSAETAKLDLQGPQSAKILQKLIRDPIADMKFYHFKHNHYKNEQVLISRTGYTGEIGFEIYLSPQSALQFWDDCINLGAIPAGLGARDTLRLEMGFPLYGHELNQDTNAAESGLCKSIANKKFIGSEVVLDSSVIKKCLKGIVLEGRRAGRQGDKILNPDKEEIGYITSGSYSPSLQKAIAMGYVLSSYAVNEQKVIIKTDRGELTGNVTDTPFYKKATGRDNLANYL
jgi:aminomethyltransferase